MTIRNPTNARVLIEAAASHRRKLNGRFTFLIHYRDGTQTAPTATFDTEEQAKAMGERVLANQKCNWERYD